jgi:uncharacterized protein YndB with AHSA1/START domain
MTLSARVIQAPPAAVHAVLEDPTTYPQWLGGARRIRRVDPDWPKAGSGFAHEVGAGPVEVQDRTEVIDWQPGRELRLLVRARPLLEADVRFKLSRDGGATRLEMTETPCGAYRAFSWLIAPLVRVRNDRSLRRLAELVEERHVT